MLQSIVLCSRKRFQITKQGDPLDLLAWFLNSLHIALNGTKKRSSSKHYHVYSSCDMAPCIHRKVAGNDFNCEIKGENFQKDSEYWVDERTINNIAWLTSFKKIELDHKSLG